jgi:hypothetical protein
VIERRIQMLTQVYEYTDYLGRNRKTTVRFNFDESELAEMALSDEGGLDEWIDQIINSNSLKDIVRIVKRVILSAYGERTEDGRFIKEDPETGAPLYRKFKSSAIFPMVFMDVCFDAKKAAAFISGCVPENMRGTMDKASEDIEAHLEELGVNQTKPAGQPTGTKILEMDR